MHFVGGFWFDGARFRAADFYVENGVLTHHLSSANKDVSTVDLKGRYVVPPYGDAHEHNFDTATATPAVSAMYLHDGIFYAQGMTDVTSGSRQVVAAGLVNTSSTVDVTYAHGCLTAREGHPKEIYESLAHGFYSASTPLQRAEVIASHTLAGDAYWEIDGATDLDKKWPAILAAKPNLIKIILSDSGRYTPESHTHPELGKGLDPALVPLITARAHRAGLKVAAHIDTAADFHVALSGEVDEMGHLPGYGVRAEDSIAPYRISDADIALAAKRHIKLQATAGVYVDDRLPSGDLKRRQASQIDNLARLKAAGVPILIGSDHYGVDSVHEADYLKSLGLWTNLEMLTMWSVTTPQDIFPGRRIGRLEEGYEASFLVLSGDPLDNWTAVHSIVGRWKRGHCVDLANHVAPADSTKSVRSSTEQTQTREVQGDNFRGRLYLSKQPGRDLALVVIGGSEGHLYEADEVGPQLAALGYDVLGVDYHDGFQGARHLSRVPVETFTHAVTWLRTNQGSRRVVVIGDSRGSEAALLTGCHDPDVNGVAAFAPSNVVWGGYGGDDVANESAWTWQGMPVPFLSFPPNVPAGSAGFDAALDQQDAEHVAEIPIEQINGPLFLAGSCADAIWPSGRMARSLQDRFVREKAKFAVQSLLFPDSSHRLFGTGPSATSVTYTIAGKDYPIAFGGSAIGTERARNETWAALIAFLNSVARL